MTIILRDDEENVHVKLADVALVPDLYTQPVFIENCAGTG